jgi:hypothetical protein
MAPPKIRPKGKTVDELAAEVLKRFVIREKLDEVSRYGHQRARDMGLHKLSEEDRMEYVNRVIHDSRQERRR